MGACLTGASKATAEAELASGGSGRVILVTGANKGIGYAMCKKILETQPAIHVLLGARDEKRGAQAVNSLLMEVPNSQNRLEFLPIDVTSDKSVRAAAAIVASRFGSSSAIWGIVNNAGIAAGNASNILNVNVYGVKRVCEAFLPMIEPTGRIVNISSGVGPGYVRRTSAQEQALLCDPAVTWETLESYMHSKGSSGNNPYGLSKAILNAYTMMLARENPGLAINACSPGYIKTDLTGGSGGLPPEAGTRAAHKLLFTQLEGNGRYYGSDGLRSPLHLQRDPGTPEYKGP